MSEKLLQNEVIQDQPLGEGVSPSQNQSSGNQVLENSTTQEQPLPQNKTKTANEVIGGKLDTVSKKILSDFDFGSQDYAGAVKSGSVEWNPSTGAITSGNGVVLYRKGIVGAKNGVATFSLDAETGDASFAGDVSSATGRYNDTFTAGENISAGKPVCIPYGYVDIYPSGDAYVSDNLPTSNFGSASELWVGGENAGHYYNAVMKFDLSSLPGEEDIITAELHLKVSATNGNNTLTISRATSTWAEGTVTYNTFPNETAITQGDTTAQITAATDWVVLNQTDTVQKWKSGTNANYGFVLKENVGSFNYTTYYSKDHPEIVNRPFLRVYHYGIADGKVYLASSSDYRTSRIVVGIAQETKNADEQIIVQTAGIVSNIAFSESAGFIYLGSTPGKMTAHLNNLPRFVKLGRIVGTNKLLFLPSTQDVLIKTITNPATSVIIPTDTRYVIVEANSNNIFVSAKVYRNQPANLCWTGVYQVVITWGDNYIAWSSTYGTVTKYSLYN